MSSQHTPGPFVIQPAFNGKHVFIVSKLTGELVAQVYRRADAPLFAAAPFLLSQLTFAAARVELANKEGDPILSAWLPDARAALASAEQLGEVNASPADIRLIAQETLTALRQAAAGLAICAKNAPEDQKAAITSWFDAARAQIRKAEVVGA
jgi:hypothetical protein